MADPRAWLAMYRERERLVGAMPEPQWRVLLDLTVNGRASVTSLCFASGAPVTTALRHLGELEAGGLIDSIGDAFDRRRRFLDLTAKGRELLAPLFGREAA